ncbi:DNA topoisomerase 2-binding protein 1-A [Eurytemora carolleeae]|uniref:DNA topoisomerase 2-binding protein 1-A n=1 Tax=Eurytemora carolleeae TaxID=1294199 RepID=UPI000C78BB31|nr:DNA topoisomerase 2-binding protein 1-A [Eurytemora carolleeae]|eukprot:XP_023332368.1 DNA topoisomerase 2-binding protein 1-A-like [Eurytemora affinis]
MEDEDEKVALRFVIPTGESELTVSDGMVNAFQLCSEQGFEPTWIKENKLLELNPTKTVTFIQGDLDVFVFDPFEGPGFEHLTKSNKFKCTVVGPMCLIPCVEENSPIPNLPYPMYSTAMKGLWITISGFHKDEKAEIQTLIERMSGMYSPVLHDGVTHIISSKVNSEKYKVAVKIPIPVMTKEWVYEVWKACKRGTVSAVDSRFLQYICPALLGLTVTVSQLSKVDRNAIKKKIETHGGYFLPELTMDETDILICVSGEGPKFEFAQKWKIPCLNIQWILHSVDKGTALPMDEYRVERESNKASTPTKEDTTVTGLEEVSIY